jgi:hypothetical protein
MSCLFGILVNKTIKILELIKTVMDLSTNCVESIVVVDPAKVAPKAIPRSKILGR